VTDYEMTKEVSSSWQNCSVCGFMEWFEGRTDHCWQPSGAVYDRGIRRVFDCCTV